MITRIGAAARRAGLGVVDFQTHWKVHHGPTAGSIPLLQRYVQYHAVHEDGRLHTAYPGFDACSELDFESGEAMDEGFRLAAETGELKADEDRFVDKTRYSWVLGSPEIRLGTPGVSVREGDDPVVLLRWYRAHPSASAQRLVDTVLGEWEQQVHAQGPTWRKVVRADAALHGARGVPSADLVEFIGFPDAGRAIEFVDGALQDLSPLLAGVAFGVADHLARRVEILGAHDW